MALADPWAEFPDAPAVAPPQPQATPSAASPAAPTFDPATSAQIDGMIRAQKPAAEIASFITANGGTPVPIPQIEAALRFAKAHPEDRNSLARVTRAAPPDQFSEFPDASGEEMPDREASGGIADLVSGKLETEEPETMSGLSREELWDKFKNDHQWQDMLGVLAPIFNPLVRHGVTAGLDTENDALISSAAEAILHPIRAWESSGNSVADAYHQARKESLARLDFLHMIRPNSAPVQEIMGAVANPLGLEARTLKGLAAYGGGFGAVSGFERSDGSFGERATDALESGALGAVAAPVIGTAFKLPGAIKNMLPRNRVPSELTQAFDRQAVDPLAAYVGGTGTQMASGVTHMTLGGIPLSEAAEKTIQQARAARERIAGKIGWVKDAMGTGRTAQRGAGSFVDTTQTIANRHYDAIPIAPDRPAQLDATRQTLSELNAGLESNPALSALIADPKLDSWKRALDSGGLSWRDLMAFRSYVGEKLNGMVFQSDTSQKALNTLYGALSRDMQATATADGPKALAAFQRANRYYRARQERIANVISPIIGEKGDGGPQAAFNQIQSWASNRGETVRIAQLVRSLPEDEAATVRASIFSRLGNAKAGQQNWEGNEFSPATFATMWHSMDPAARAALFPGEKYRADIDDILRITHAMRDSAKFANTSKTALGVNAFGHMSGLLANPVYTIMAASGEFGAGKLLASPKFARWLASSPKKPNAPAMLDHIRRLNSVAAAQPAIANEVHQLQERLASFFTSAPLAAQQEDNVGEPVPQQ